MRKIVIASDRPKQIVDVTERIERELKGLGVIDGVCTLFVTHTTAALTTADLDPGTDLDMLDAFDQLIPKLRYRHPHDPGHVPDHILASLIGPALALPVGDGKLVLGTWQRVVLVELDGPRERQVLLSV
ncbi:secondary thiamine-phosphate synthase enzyme YjbQ [Candidatus Parcubacteria bacterium]|nr:secondary thiamine-phosphate synthase enzyme YjbQ [Candidatus Parcubacteria bacterium]